MAAPRSQCPALSSVWTELSCLSSSRRPRPPARAGGRSGWDPELPPHRSRRRRLAPHSVGPHRKRPAIACGGMGPRRRRPSSRARTAPCSLPAPDLTISRARSLVGLGGSVWSPSPSVATGSNSPPAPSCATSSNGSKPGASRRRTPRGRAWPTATLRRPRATSRPRSGASCTIARAGDAATRTGRVVDAPRASFSSSITGTRLATAATIRPMGSPCCAGPQPLPGRDHLRPAAHGRAPARRGPSLRSAGFPDNREGGRAEGSRCRRCGIASAEAVDAAHRRHRQGSGPTVPNRLPAMANPRFLSLEKVYGPVSTLTRPTATGPVVTPIPVKHPVRSVRSRSAAQGGIPWRRSAASHVPHDSLLWAHAVAVPATTRAANGHPPDSSQASGRSLVSRSRRRRESHAFSA
jgi:hypothetical protein